VNGGGFWCGLKTAMLSRKGGSSLSRQG